MYLFLSRTVETLHKTYSAIFISCLDTRTVSLRLTDDWKRKRTVDCPFFLFLCIIFSLSSWLIQGRKWNKQTKPEVRGWFSHPGNSQHGGISLRCITKLETEEKTLLIILQCHFLGSLSSEAAGLILQEGRRKQFFMGGRAPVKEVLMRHCGHGLLSTTKMALEVVGWDEGGHMTLIWGNTWFHSVCFRFLSNINCLNFLGQEERINICRFFTCLFYSIGLYFLQTWSTEVTCSRTHPHMQVRSSTSPLSLGWVTTGIY